MIGKRLKEIRVILGLSQDEFGRQVGIQQDLISKYETGKREMGINNAIKIVLAFKINGHWLLTGEGDRFLEGSKKSGRS